MNDKIVVDTAEQDAHVRDIEAQLRVALAASRMALWELDIASDTIHGSRELYRLLGFPDDAEPTTEEMRAYYAPGERDRIRSLGAEALARGERVLECDFRYIGPDAVERWLTLRTEAIFNAEGQLSKAVGVVFDITERKNAEEELARTKRRLDAVLANTSMSIFLMDDRQRCVFANAAAEAMSGFSASELIERTLHEVVHHKRPDGTPYPIEECPIDRALLQRSRMQGEELFVHADGSFYPIAFTASPVRDEAGTPVGTVVEARNISAERDREEALRESEERFRAMADSAPIMLWVGDANGKCAYLNKALRDFWGVDVDAISSFDWTPTIHPEDLDKVDIPFREGMSEATRFSTEARYRRADGQYRILATTASPRLGPRGEFLGMVGVNVDVTEVRETHGALLREKRNLEIINETGASVALERDHDKIVQMVTDAAVALTGAQFGAFFYNVIDAEGDSFMLYALSGAERAAFDKFPMPRATSIFRPTFVGEGVVRSDDILTDPRYGQSGPHFGMPKGHLPVRSYLAVPVISRTGEVIGGILLGHKDPGVFDDDHAHLLTGIAGHSATAIDNARLFQAAEREISDRKSAEARLQELNATLEERVQEEVNERTKAEEVLRQAQKMEAVGQLTGGIAHDFNNLLAVVIGGLNLVQRKLRKGETASLDRYIDGAIDGANRAAALTQRLLAFSRKQPLQPELIDPNELVAGMTELLERTIGERVIVNTVLPETVWPIMADKVQLENSILNLAVNARDAMVNGGKLTIETANSQVDARTAHQFDIQPAHYAVISVSDCGEGMPADVLTKAFEPFFTTKAVGKGTGLGLSQVFGFVRQTGGCVRIHSEVNVGTTVKLYLPRFDGEQVPIPVSSETSLADSPGVGTVLVVEDDDRVRNYAVEALTELGYEVLVARSGSEALDQMRTHGKPDLLFTDVVMPEMTGKELADRAAEIHPDIRVLFTTGYTRDAIVHTSSVDRHVNLLQKPYSLDELDAKVRASVLKLRG
jgi:PAS domain S-box-containing protein